MNKIARKIKAIPVIISVFIRNITDNVQPSIIKITNTGLYLILRTDQGADGSNVTAAPGDSSLAFRT